MDIKRKRDVEGAQGSAASFTNPSWDERASSWQNGANTTCAAIEAEKSENDTRYGVPYDDNFPDPAAGNSSDGPLPNPHNFSSNPGFMGAGPRGSLHPQNGSRETGGGLVSGSTAISKPNSTIGRGSGMGHGNVGLPDQQATDPGVQGDVAPQVVTTGFGH